MFTVSLFNTINGDSDLREFQFIQQAMAELARVVLYAEEPGLTATVEGPAYQLIAYFEFKGETECSAH